MSEFHYVRTTGVDGGVDACDGAAIGVDLESILAKGLPPAKVALEIIASMCEILDIADQDGEVHGDVNPKYVFLDDTGAVSIEGFGAKRKSARAPEGDPVGTATDLYGLGYTAFRLLGGKVDAPKDDPDHHDDTVIDAIVGLGFGDIPEEFHGDIQWFLAKLMSYEPDDRPPAVDAWRTFVAFADETDGMRVEDWAPDAIEGRGERRTATAAPPPPSAEPSESLGGPTKSKGPLAKGAIDFSSGGGKPASATAFWSKEALKGALAASEPTDEDAGAADEAPSPFGGGYKPQAAAATSFWSKDQLEAEKVGPKRGAGAGQRPPRAAPPAGPGAAPTPDAGAATPAWGAQPAAGTPAATPAWGAQPAAGTPAATPAWGAQPAADAGAWGAQPAAGTPAAGTPAWGAQPAADAWGAQPAAGAPAATPAYTPGPVPPAPPAEEAAAGGKGMLVGGVVVVLFLVLCLGGGAIAAAVYFLSGGEESTTSTDVDDDADKDDEKDEDKPKRDTGAPEAEPAPAPAAVGVKPAPSTSPKPAPSTSPKPAPTTSTRPAPAPTTSTRPAPAPTTSTRPAPAPSTSVRPKPAPAPAPAAGGKAKVTFNVGTRGTIGCSDGQSVAVDGSKSIEFESYQLPVSCMITVDGGGRWAGLIGASGTIACSGSGSGFSCTGP